MQECAFYLAGPDASQAGNPLAFHFFWQARWARSCLRSPSIFGAHDTCSYVGANTIAMAPEFPAWCGKMRRPWSLSEATCGLVAISSNVSQRVPHEVT
jgi:hypothetical protein